MLVRRRKRKTITTDSNHPYRKYPNLIKTFIPLKANELWVSDITYIDTREGFMYLSLITDAYSHKIVGYHLGDTLEAHNCILALQQAHQKQGALIKHWKPKKYKTSSPLRGKYQNNGAASERTSPTGF